MYGLWIESGRGKQTGLGWTGRAVWWAVRRSTAIYICTEYVLRPPYAFTSHSDFLFLSHPQAGGRTYLVHIHPSGLTFTSGEGGPQGRWFRHSLLDGPKPAWSGIRLHYNSPRGVSYLIISPTVLYFHCYLHEVCYLFIAEYCVWTCLRSCWS